MTKPLFLQAFDKTNETVPVWFMRQAGRYLPEYQALKKNYALEDMFKTPELAAEITCQPVDILGVDAAILFADILTLPTAMGFNITFDNRKGPIIETCSSFDHVGNFTDLDYVARTIKMVNQRLSESVPLIGFAGGPFTVLTYLIEGGSSTNFTKTFSFIHHQTDAFHKMMQKLTDNTIAYLLLQKQAGIKAFQLFDTWAGMLRPMDYAHWVLPYVKQVFKQVDLPSIYYVKNTHHLLSLMDQTDADFLSVDHTVVLGHHTIITKTKKGVQGNLFNGLLYADRKTLAREVNDVLVGGLKHDRFIFNLSHGVFPDIAVDQLKAVVKQVHSFNMAGARHGAPIQSV